MNNPNNNTNNSSIHANKHNNTNCRNVTANNSSSRRGSSVIAGTDNNNNGNNKTASATSDSLYATAAAAMGLPSHPHHVTFGTSNAGNIGAAAATAAALGSQTNDNNATTNNKNNHNPTTTGYWDHLMSMDSSALYATMDINAVVADVLGGSAGSSAGGNGSAIPVDPLNFAGLTSLSSNSGNNNAASAAATSTARGFPSQQPLSVPPSSFFSAFQQQQQATKVSAGAAAPSNAIMLSQQQRQQMQHLLTQPQSLAQPPPYNNNSGAGASGGGVTVSSKPSIASTPASMLINSAPTPSVVASSNIPKPTGSAVDLASSSTGPSTLAANASAEEKAAFHRERNRQHARSTRARKKAYVNKLKELVEHLHMERTEEARKRRVAASTQAETSRVRKSVVLKFLELHSCNISNTTTTSTNIIAANLATNTSSNTNVRRIPTLNDFTSICEEHCTLKQPITPFRWFNRCEISGEHRLSRGVSSIYADCCSMNVMIANIGCRSPRWGTLRQYDFFGGNVHQLHHSSSNNTGGGAGDGSGSTIGSGSRSNGGLSSLSSASIIGNNSNGNTKSPQDHTSHAATATNTNANPTVSNAAGSGGGAAVNSKQQQPQQLVEAGLHDYHAQPLPDPLLSGDDCSDDSNNPNAASTTGTSTCASLNSISNSKKRKLTSLPAQQQQQQSSRIQPPRKFAPVIALPPFVGVGKRAGEHNLNNPNSSNKKLKPNTNQVSSTLAVYNLNQDDMLLTNDTLMSPYTFRTVNAIQQGALSEVFQMGMLRVTFSSYNRLTSIEMVYDAMGFMQQLERANGASIPLPPIRDRSGRLTQEEEAEEEEEDVGSLVVPNGLEMALQPCGSCEARVITLASPPYTIVSVNEGFVRLTKFTQLDAEGKTLDDLLGVSGSSLPLHQQNQFMGSDGSTSCILDRNSSSRGTTTAAGSTGEDTNSSSNNHVNLNSKMMVSTAGASTGATSTSLAGKTITRGSTTAIAATAAAGKSSNTARSHLSQGMMAKTLTPHLPTHRTLLHATKSQRDDDRHHEEEVEEDGSIKSVRQQFANFISSYPLTNVNNQVTHILHVCRELRSRWPDAPFGIGTDTAGGGAGRHHHSLSDMRVVGVRGADIASSDDYSG